MREIKEILDESKIASREFQTSSPRSMRQHYSAKLCKTEARSSSSTWEGKSTEHPAWLIKLLAILQVNYSYLRSAMDDDVSYGLIKASWHEILKKYDKNHVFAVLSDVLRAYKNAERAPTPMEYEEAIIAHIKQQNEIQERNKSKILALPETIEEKMRKKHRAEQEVNKMRKLLEVKDGYSFP